MGGTNDRSFGSFFSDIRTGFESLSGRVTLKDYQHASKLFVDSNFRLLPKEGYLFHVAFDFDPSVPYGRTVPGAKIEAGLLVKEVTLPTFSVDKKVFSSYNRKTVVQSKVNYGDVDITFHDDANNTTTALWQEYFKYYYGDSTKPEELYHIKTKYNERAATDWGFIPPNTPFFRSIRIYSLSQHKYTGYILVNPIITDWRGGNHATTDQGEGTLENRMTVAYENILFSHGDIVEAADEPKYFTELHYDNKVSPLGKGQGNANPASIFGAGGAINTVDDVFSNLANGNVLGAASSAIHGFKNFSDIKATLKDEAWNIGRDIVRGNNVGDRFYFDNPLKSIATGVQGIIKNRALPVTTTEKATSVSTANVTGNARSAAAKVVSNGKQIGAVSTIPKVTPQNNTVVKNIVANKTIPPDIPIDFYI